VTSKRAEQRSLRDVRVAEGKDKRRALLMSLWPAKSSSTVAKPDAATYTI